MKKINSHLVKVEMLQGAMWLHTADWGSKENNWRPILVGLSWHAQDKWSPSRWGVYKTVGNDRLYRDFESLPEAFRAFKSLLK